MPPPGTQEVEESKEERMERERAERELEAKSEFEKLQEARRLLPMFPYRQGSGRSDGCSGGFLRYFEYFACAPCIMHGG